MSDIKYEPVFGDQSLFDGAPEDADMIGYSGGFYKNSPDGPMYCCGCTFTTDEYRNKGFIAMRRIIKEPKRWTWEDEKAGRLPEVGAHFLIEGNLAEFIGLSHAPNNWCFRRLDGEHGIQTANKDWFAPIETPAEKAQRLRDEWVEYALDLYMSSPKNDVASMGEVYDAPLSGELQAPKWGE